MTINTIFHQIGYKMSIQTLSGLASVSGDYDLFIIDLWGVMHDGVNAYPEAIKCLNQLRLQDARIVLLSNAARTSRSIIPQLHKLGITEALFDRLITSGDATIKAITDIAKKNARKDYSTYFHIGPERTQATLDACGGIEVPLEDAELVICTALDNDETEQVEDYAELLKTAAHLGLPMICANPDLTVKRKGKDIVCAGALAAFYEQIGGKVEYYGKPSSYIYDLLFSDMPEIRREGAVMIGDSLATDIRGARQAGIDAIWITNGIHAAELGIHLDDPFDSSKVINVAERAGESPRAVLPWLRW